MIAVAGHEGGVFPALGVQEFGELFGIGGAVVGLGLFFQFVQLGGQMGEILLGPDLLVAQPVVFGLESGEFLFQTGVGSWSFEFWHG
jgi:hypothetical protein